MIHYLDDPGRPLMLQGDARDIETGDDGEPIVRDRASMDVRIDFHADRILTDLSSSPADKRLSSLVGVSAASGFRRKLTEVAPDLHSQRSLLHLLLDDIPVATLVSGQSVAVRMPQIRSDHQMSQFVGGSGYCAGFAPEATMMTTFREHGYIPTPTGPPAPELEAPDDPAGWHTMEPLPLHGMRRKRRIDVRPGEVATVDAMFRDSYVRGDGVETVVHEYDLAATVDRETMTILSIEATPRVLPWVECPVAAKSADRLIGLQLSELNATVRQELQGTSTCTHLNDLLRNLADVEALLQRR